MVWPEASKIAQSEMMSGSRVDEVEEPLMLVSARKNILISPHTLFLHTPKSSHICLNAGPIILSMTSEFS